MIPFKINSYLLGIAKYKKEMGVYLKPLVWDWDIKLDIYSESFSRVQFNFYRKQAALRSIIAERNYGDNDSKNKYLK